MFMHGGWEHMLGNMLFLWIFGNNVEDALGRVRFLLWYLAGGLAATARADVRDAPLGLGADASIPNIGASGAIAAVLGAYFVLLPNATCPDRDLLHPHLLPGAAGDASSSASGSCSSSGRVASRSSQPEAGGGVAFFAHIGGFVFGALTVRLVAVLRPLETDV